MSDPHTASGAPGARDVLAACEVAVVRADNPGPFTLTGTNTWVVGRGPCWVIDPGPALAGHLDAVVAEVGRRGGAGGLVLTHGHHDHAEGVPALAGRVDAPIVAVGDGGRVGPLVAVATPGHTPDHLAYVRGDVVFTGDSVLGEGSAFLAPDPGALRGYLAALERLRALEPALLCPGHGPVVTDPDAHLAGYLAHRHAREGALVAALERGLRGIDELLDAAWAEVPAVLRPVAAITMAAHLDKLEEDGRLPPGVERPRWPPPGGPG
ncbi:MAG: MBL fold metallo-hydrolase [Solirubrobacteraceae bacterium MAG38_C4-C5]|nr:MBL fold metallo-hydrolase [Candidatus Siliceabacter maunaloa]